MAQHTVRVRKTFTRSPFASRGFVKDKPIEEVGPPRGKFMHHTVVVKPAGEKATPVTGHWDPSAGELVLDSCMRDKPPKMETLSPKEKEYNEAIHALNLALERMRPRRIPKGKKCPECETYGCGKHFYAPTPFAKGEEELYSNRLNSCRIRVQRALEGLNPQLRRGLGLELLDPKEEKERLEERIREEREERERKRVEAERIREERRRGCAGR